MKTTISKTKEREVFIFDNGTAKVEVTVRSAWLRPGYSKRTWDEATVLLTRDELRQIAERTFSATK